MTEDDREDALDEGNDGPVLEELDGLLSQLSGESPPEALVARTLRAVAEDQAGLGAGDDAGEADEVLRHTSGIPWRLVAAVLLAAILIAGVATVQFAGKIQALFETADAAIDTVDSDL